MAMAAPLWASAFSSAKDKTDNTSIVDCYSEQLIVTHGHMQKHLEWGMKAMCGLLQALPLGCGCRSSLLCSTVWSCPDPVSRGWTAGDNACWRWRRSPGETPPPVQQLTPILNQASNPSIVALT